MWFATPLAPVMTEARPVSTVSINAGENVRPSLASVDMFLRATLAIDSGLSSQQAVTRLSSQASDALTLQNSARDGVSLLEADTLI
jgi:hypothetical protein